MPPRHAQVQRPSSTQHTNRPPPAGQQAGYRAAGSSGWVAAPQRDPVPKYEAAIRSAKVRRDAAEQQRMQKYGQGGGGVRPLQQSPPQQQWQPRMAAQQVQYAPAQWQQEQPQPHHQPTFAAQQVQHAQQAEHVPQQADVSATRRQQELQHQEALHERRSSGAGASSSGTSSLNGKNMLLQARQLSRRLDSTRTSYLGTYRSGLLLQATHR